MRLKKLRMLALTVACGGLVYGAGCGAFITDTLLQIGLTTVISNVLTGVTGS